MAYEIQAIKAATERIEQITQDLKENRFDRLILINDLESIQSWNRRIQEAIQDEVEAQIALDRINDTMDQIVSIDEIKSDLK